MVAAQANKPGLPEADRPQLLTVGGWFLAHRRKLALGCCFLLVISLGVTLLRKPAYAPANPHTATKATPPPRNDTPAPPQPAATTNTSYYLGVLVLKYFPLTADGQNIDINVTGDEGDSYVSIRQHTVDMTNNLVAALEKASKYLGYKNPDAPSALTYHIVDTKEYKSAVPIKPRADAPTYPDYNGLLNQNNICDYVDSRGVREVWIWAYQGPSKPGTNYPYLGISESKMSGPYGDISNSPRYSDMPLCKHTYEVYTFNYERGTGEAMHSWGHQLEAELTAVDSHLFRDLFQGPNYPQTLGVTGRCGSVHNPPNARSEYDWANPTPQKSDCLDWQPDGMGTLSSISCTTWGCDYISDDNNPQLNWMIWLWQNLPGRGNTKTYNGQPLRNWWDVHGDFDGVMGGRDKSLVLP